MTSFNIYNFATQKQIDNFKPTFLYIKQHSVTGKLYFGKSNKTYDSFVKYRGSGSYWTKHIKKHGSQIETLWYCLFTDVYSLVEFAVTFCQNNNIGQRDTSIWANQCIETGLGGGSLGFKHSVESNEQNRQRQLGKKQSKETIEKRTSKNKGKTWNADQKEKHSLLMSTRKLYHTTETKLNLSISKKLKFDPNYKPILYHTPFGVFISGNEASKSDKNISKFGAAAITAWCINCDTPLNRKSFKNPDFLKGTIPRLLGWYTSQINI